MKAKSLAAFAACLVLSAYGTAEAKPRKATSVIVCDERMCHPASPASGKARQTAYGANGSALVAEARRHLGATARDLSLPARLWCADFMNMALRNVGASGTGSRLARSFASYGRRVPGPQVGAIAVMSRGKLGGHVGVVSGVDESGNPIVISGNHNRRVAEAVYPRERIYAFVMP